MLQYNKRRNLDKFRLVALTKTALKATLISKKNYFNNQMVWFKSSAVNCWLANAALQLALFCACSDVG
jgi:hypothetical protein